MLYRRFFDNKHHSIFYSFSSLNGWSTLMKSESSPSSENEKQDRKFCFLSFQWRNFEG